MRHQLPEGEEGKKHQKQSATGSQEGNPGPDLLADDEIDPADFFDPEEFGYRRRGFDARTP
jgi:hypothetical protein